MYNIPKFTEHFEQKHPSVVDDHIAEIEEFAKVSLPAMSGPSPSSHVYP
jgi:hypothetical protein